MKIARPHDSGIGIGFPQSIGERTARNLTLRRSDHQRQTDGLLRIRTIASWKMRLANRIRRPIYSRFAVKPFRPKGAVPAPF